MLSVVVICVVSIGYLAYGGATSSDVALVGEIGDGRRPVLIASRMALVSSCLCFSVSCTSLSIRI